MNPPLRVLRATPVHQDIESSRLEIMADGSRRRLGISRGSCSFVRCAIAGAMILQLLVPRIQALGLAPPERLRRLLDSTHRGDAPIQIMPCVYDGLTARMVAQSGFNVTFMTGFGVSSSRGFPDTQLISYNEMLIAADSVAEGLSSAALELSPDDPVAIPCIADGDTGYGNAVNVKRTVHGYARSGWSAARYTFPN